MRPGHLVRVLALETNIMNQPQFIAKVSFQSSRNILRMKGEHCYERFCDAI